MYCREKKKNVKKNQTTTTHVSKLVFMKAARLKFSIQYFSFGHLGFLD